MNSFFVNIIFCIASTVLVFSAPETYSYNFCLSIAILYLIQNVFYFILKKDKNIVCFEFLFMIAFFFTNFAYPIAYYPTVERYVSNFNFPFNENIISKGTAIAYFAYTFLLLGLTKKSWKKEKLSVKENFSFPPYMLRIIFLLTLITFLIFFISGGVTALRDVYSNEGDINEVGVFSYFNILFTIFCYLLAMFLFRNTKNSSIVLYGLFILLFGGILLTTGSRAFAIGLFSIIIVSFNDNYKKIPFLWVALGIILGAFALTFIVFVRSTNFSQANWFESGLAVMQLNSVFDIFLDLIINNRNLYVLVDYTDIHGYTYLTGMISEIVSPVPGLVSYILENVTDKPMELISGGHLTTFLEFGTGSSFGLGSNMVGEAYKSFGLLGVIFFFYMIGFIINKTEEAKNYNIYAYVVYYLLISHAIFYPRATILFNPRIIVWSLLTIYLIKTFTIKKSFYSTQSVKNSNLI